MVSELAEKGVNSLTLDGMPRITRTQTMDALTSMSTVAGYKVFLWRRIVSENLCRWLELQWE